MKDADMQTKISLSKSKKKSTQNIFTMAVEKQQIQWVLPPKKRKKINTDISAVVFAETLMITSKDSEMQAKSTPVTQYISTATPPNRTSSWLSNIIKLKSNECYASDVFLLSLAYRLHVPILVYYS